MTDRWTRETLENVIDDERLMACSCCGYPSIALGFKVAAALLAAAECEECHLYGQRADCLDCKGTGYNQSSLARAFATLRGAGT